MDHSKYPFIISKVCSLFVSGPVKKCGLFKILHERYKQVGKKNISMEVIEFRQSLEEAAELYKDIAPHIGKAQVSEDRLL